MMLRYPVGTYVEFKDGTFAHITEVLPDDRYRIYDSGSAAFGTCSDADIIRAVPWKVHPAPPLGPIRTFEE